MIRHLIVLYLAIAVLILVGPNPLWVLPLLLISASFITGNRWIGLVGAVAFGSVSLSRIDPVSLEDLFDLLVLVLTVCVPLIAAIELVLSDKPYRLEKVRWAPLAIASLLVGGMIASLFILIRVQRIGVYLRSDPSLQVFIIISMAVLFTGPILLSSGSLRGR